MKFSLAIYLLGLAILASTQSCTYNKEKILYPPKPCDTIAVSFKKTIKPLIVANCTSVGCHITSNPSNNIVLENYLNIKDQVLTLKNGIPLIYGAVAQLTGFTQMPKGGTKLTSCEIAKLKAWINQGALDN